MCFRKSSQECWNKNRLSRKLKWNELKGKANSTIFTSGQYEYIHFIMTFSKLPVICYYVISNIVIISPKIVICLHNFSHCKNIHINIVFIFEKHCFHCDHSVCIYVCRSFFPNFEFEKNEGNSGIWNCSPKFVCQFQALFTS